MFTPTSFPCTAWYVTRDLDVLSLRAQSVRSNPSPWVITDSRTHRLMHVGDLFATRDEAIGEAERRLDLKRTAHAELGREIECRSFILGMMKGGAA